LEPVPTARMPPRSSTQRRHTCAAETLFLAAMLRTFVLVNSRGLHQEFTAGILIYLRTSLSVKRQPFMVLYLSAAGEGQGREEKVREQKHMLSTG